MTFLHPYIRLALALAGVAVAGYLFAPMLTASFALHHEARILLAFFDIAALFTASFVAYYAARKTKIPAFVVAMLMGIAAKPFLQGIVSSTTALPVIVGIGATLILFSGGLETSFARFRQSFLRIFSLSVPGLIITAVLFSVLLILFAGVLAIPIAVSSAVLLGAILASTDPAAIVPLLKGLRFRDECTRTIIIAESAVTDAVGALLTVSFLTVFAQQAVTGGIIQSYGKLVTPESLLMLAEQLIFGALFGLIGFLALEGLMRFKKKHEGEVEADTAFFLSVPIGTFIMSMLFGGSGYLAAFIAGLLFNMKRQLHNSNLFFERIIDGFLKPTIFLLLGALIDLPELLHYAPLGIAIALAFIFIIRPFVVFLTLGPFMLTKKSGMKWQDLLFISFVRETGAVPAVLLISLIGLAIPEAHMMIAIGMWVILLTLVIEPPLTPWLATRLGVADPIKAGDVAHIDNSGKPFVVLGTRGFSYKRRLPFVMEWAAKHGIDRVVVLLCLEGRYTKEAAELEKKECSKSATKIRAKLKKQGSEPVKVEMIANKGFLQKNIAHLAKQHNDIAVIFIGKRVLDFRLEEIKNLQVPMYFLK